MDFEFSLEDEKFREDVREFLAEKLTPDMREASEKTTTVFADKDLAMRWQLILLEKGWAVPAWPVEHGGTNWSPASYNSFACCSGGAIVSSALTKINVGTVSEPKSPSKD